MSTEEKIRDLEQRLAAATQVNAKLSARVAMMERRALERFNTTLRDEMKKLGVGEEGADAALRLHRAAVGEKLAGYSLAVEDDGDIEAGSMVNGKRASSVAEFAKLLLAEHPFINGGSSPGTNEAHRSTSTRGASKRLEEMTDAELWDDTKGP